VHDHVFNVGHVFDRLAISSFVTLMGLRRGAADDVKPLNSGANATARLRVGVVRMY
jgi:hypothetical protein